MAEMALVSVRKASLSAEARRGSKTAQRALGLAEQPNKFLSTIQIGITLTAILTGIYSGAALAESFGTLLASIGINPSYSQTLAQVIIVIVVTYCTLVLGELVPKRIGQSAPERIAKAVSGPMTFLSRITQPIVWMLSQSTVAVLKLLGIKYEGSRVTEEEIKSLIQEGTEGGEVQEVEQDIMERVFSLGDRRIESIMTHRSDIIWLEVSSDRNKVYEMVKANPHAIYPVGEGALDKIVGVVTMKDLFSHIHDVDFSLSNIIKPAYFIHENLEVYPALEQMRIMQHSYSFIADEFGLIQGMVTHKDILEAFIGLIPEDGEEPYIVERSDGSYLVDGQCPFYDFLTHFEQEDLYPDHEYNTLSGLILEELGHIPLTGEKVSWKMFSFEILDMDAARIDKVLVNIDHMDAAGDEN